MIESLEPRIAPAAILTFTDIDGDRITIKSSTGTTQMLTEAALFKDWQIGKQLVKLTLGSAFANAAISIVATPIPGKQAGDGQVDVGYIDATGTDLRSVIVDGDLGAIDVGAPSKAGFAIRSLQVHSLGANGTSTGAQDLASDIDGAFGVIKIRKDIRGASIRIIDTYVPPPNPGAPPPQSTGTIQVGGSVVGEGAVDSGSIGGALRAVIVAGDIRGGAGDSSGVLFVENATQVTVGGSVIGGSGPNSGRIGVGNDLFDESPVLARVYIGGDVRGGSGNGSGAVGGMYIHSLYIAGSLVGGSNHNTGEIGVDFLDQVTIRRDIIGGSVESGYLSGSGLINSNQIGRANIGGSVIAGVAGPGTILERSGFISTHGGPLGQLTVGGSLIGNPTHRVGILSSYFSDLVREYELSAPLLQRIVVNGTVELADIIAGTNPGSPDRYEGARYPASIGTVVVRGDWLASNLVASASAGPNGMYGDFDDTLIFDAPRSPDVPARIERIEIGGRVVGTFSSTADHYGFVAEEIGAFVAGGRPFLLTPGAANDNRLVAFSGDARLRELAAVEL